MATKRRGITTGLTIVSGGQTGVDRAALDAAQAYGFPVGGWCPAGRRAEDGVIPSHYPLAETPADTYDERTEWNVRDSDGTLIISASPLRGGTALTARLARANRKPLLLCSPSSWEPSEVIEWLISQRITVLNVAGPRESEAPGIYRAAHSFLTRLLNMLTAEI